MGSARYLALSREDEDELKVHLVDGGLIVAGVFGLHYADWLRCAYPGLKSSFGELCAPGKYRA